MGEIKNLTMYYIILNDSDLNNLIKNKPEMITKNINIMIFMLSLFLGDLICAILDNSSNDN